MTTAHLLIKGKVQGVFYRDTAKSIALKLSITGWVKNTTDGHVEAIITGNEEELKQFVEWAHRGPREAKVSEVIRTDRAPEQFEKFWIEE